jgi:hypothetical protein
MSLRVCSRFVFRCFKALEHAGDTITGVDEQMCLEMILIPHLHRICWSVLCRHRLDPHSHWRHMLL